jgi:uncharacterized damage-inducible protein DinB
VTELPPVPERVHPPVLDGERAAVEAWLEFHRATLLHKCAGLTPEQLGERSVPPSALSLRGLVRHLTEVETGWFRQVLAGQDVEWRYCGDDDPDGDFDGVGRDTDEPDTATAVAREFAALTAAVEASRALAAGHASLDDVGVGTRHGRPVSLRWIYLHMIEEYARHNGHADLLRERIDGVTGE